ncbi:Golgi transport complex subunit 1, variant 2 [Chamberlinius hualienensis]
MIKTADNVLSLFEKMTIGEIQEYEKNTRLEMEKLKEDLRVMVGERYRDLIEAADTIGDMKESVEKISIHVKNMQNFTTAVKSNLDDPSNANSLREDYDIKPYYSIASEIKLLVDIPSKIWVCIESGDLLNAAQLYMFAQHVHTNLELELKEKNELSSPRFGIVSRQWTSIVQFKSFILNYCNEVIRSSGVEDQKVAKSICALLCLTDSTPRKLCSDFLVCKMNELEKILSTHIRIANVKEQLALSINEVVETISLVYLIFCPTGNGESLLFNIVKTLTDKSRCDLLNRVVPPGTVWFKYIPTLITGYYPTLQLNSNSIPDEFLKETCEHWITSVKQVLNNGITRILSFINNVKGIASLQESVEETLLQINTNETWINACIAFFGRELNIWEEFLSTIFIDRIKSVIEAQIEKTFQQTKVVLNEIFDELQSDRASFDERDICGYIWTEEAGDMPVKFAWKDGTHDKDGGNLTMKVKGFTPRVQNISQSLDLNLKIIMDDIGCYVGSCSQLSQVLSFNAAAELEALRSHLQVTCHELVKRIVFFVKETLSSTSISQNKHILLNKALFLARICSALSELNTNLQKGITGSAINTKDYCRDAFAGTFMPGKYNSQKVDENAVWHNVTQMLNEENLAMFNLWKDVILEDFRQNLPEMVVDDTDTVLKHIPRWDTIEIREESEEGVSVNSTISVPMQPSIKLMKLLYWICIEINKVGGHIIPRTVLQSLQTDVLISILKVYEQYFNEVKEKGRLITQSLSLQMSFDVKFVAGLISTNSKQVQYIDTCRLYCQLN